MDPSHATNQDWADLLAAAHARGMAVIMWINLGYGSIHSAYWEQARQDQANGVSSKYSCSFYWSTTGTEPLPENYRWLYDDVAKQYYAARWDWQPEYTTGGRTPGQRRRRRCSDTGLTPAWTAL